MMSQPSYGLKAHRGIVETTCLTCKKTKNQLLLQAFSSDSGYSKVCNGTWLHVPEST